jgi:two-component system alkaline phosphatase synthesis response regulator PhoP
MTKILLFSKDKEDIEKIKKLLENENYELLVKKISYKAQYNNLYNILLKLKNPIDTKLIILDINKIENSDIIINTSNNEPSFSKILRIINKYEIAKLFILSYNQQDLLFSNNIKSADFLFYPHLNKELLIRVKYLLSNIENPAAKNNIVIDKLILDLDKYELTINGKIVELTFKEYELLKFLLQNKNKVFSRDKLLSIIWDYDFYGGSRTVDVHIRRLRYKINNPYSTMLRTVRNVGYMFSP